MSGLVTLLRLVQASCVLQKYGPLRTHIAKDMTGCGTTSLESFQRKWFPNFIYLSQKPVANTTNNLYFCHYSKVVLPNLYLAMSRPVSTMLSHLFYVILQKVVPNFCKHNISRRFHRLLTYFYVIFQKRRFQIFIYIIYQELVPPIINTFLCYFPKRVVARFMYLSKVEVLDTYTFSYVILQHGWFPIFIYIS